MTISPKKIQSFEIQRKEIDMKAWVKDKFKNGKDLKLINYSELKNERFTLVNQYQYGEFFKRKMQVTEIKGEIIDNKLVYKTQISLVAQLGLLVFGIILII